MQKYSRQSNQYIINKNVNGTQYTYLYHGGNLMQETVGTKILDYFYDASGKPLAVKYRTSANATGTYYYYARNSRGDVIGLYNAAGSLYRTYSYDVWGNILSVKDANGNDITSQTDIANLQSLKYRGYYYDYETGLYYLQSRYYDPVTHRLINEDGLVSTGTGVLGYNMFAYCGNNSVRFSDNTGERYDDLFAENKKARLKQGGSQRRKSNQNAPIAPKASTGEIIFYSAVALLASIEMDAGAGFGIGAKGGIKGLADLSLYATDTINLHVDGYDGAKFNIIDSLNATISIGIWNFSLIDTSQTYNFNLELENKNDNSLSVSYLDKVGISFGGYTLIGASLSFNWNLKRVFKQWEVIWG